MGITTFRGKISKRICDVLYKAENHHLNMISGLNSGAYTTFFNPGEETVEKNGKMVILHEL